LLVRPAGFEPTTPWFVEKYVAKNERERKSYVIVSQQ